MMENNQDTRNNSQVDTLNNYFWEDKQIKAILGYPVKRIVRDRQGNVILNVGDIISFRAVEQVKQADVLNALLHSVYRK